MFKKIRRKMKKKNQLKQRLPEEGFMPWYDRLADWLATWCGSWSFFNLHIIWFAVWLIFKLDINELTLIVSLEAIILMAVLLMAQNREAEKDNIRDEADYHADLNSEKHIREVKSTIRALEKKLEDGKIIKKK